MKSHYRFFKLTSGTRAYSLSALALYVVLSGTTVMPASGDTPKKDTKDSSKTAPAGKSSAGSIQSAPNDVIGDWVSDWGPVKFARDDHGTVTGSWQEGKGRVGKIDSGKFDQSTGKLDFSFEETWTQLKGKAKLKLSSDHKQLSGDWTREKDKKRGTEDKGTWLMHRPNAEEHK